MTDNTELVPIAVPGTDRQILATLINGQPMVSLRHSCEAIGLEPARQIQKLNNRSWATVYMTANVPSAGVYEVTTIPETQEIHVRVVRLAGGAS